MSRIEEAIMKANLMRQTSLGKGETTHDAPSDQAIPEKNTRPWIYACGLLLALAAGGGIYHFASERTILSAPKPVAATLSVTPAPAARQAVQPPPPAKATNLPAGIPLNAPDPEFPASHPGWQRYTTSELDFRIFREGTAVRAIQVIARGEKAIENAFFSSFLSDVARGDKHTLHTGTERNGFYVEQGMAGKTAELLVYRTKPAGEIRAFVVAYL